MCSEVYCSICAACREFHAREVGGQQTGTGVCPLSTWGNVLYAGHTTTTQPGGSLRYEGESALVLEE